MSFPTHRNLPYLEQNNGPVLGGKDNLTYQLMENTNAALSYTRTQTHSSEGSNNFEENTVTINLTRNF